MTDFMEDAQRIPPLTANIGQACYACFKDQEDGINLQRCTICRSLRYCGTECQKANWAQHKAFCKALNKIENDPVLRSTSIFSLADAPSDDLGTLNMIIESSVQNDIRAIETIIRRSITIPERNLVAWEPRCMGCGRSDRLMRIEASFKGSDTTSTQTPNTLKACSHCKMAFYCSDAHWEAVRYKHEDEPCEDGHDGLSQCKINQEIRTDIKFANIMAGAKLGAFSWAPERVKSSWTSLKGISWEEEFGVDLAEQFRIPVSSVGSWIRAASDALSMPMTILWALESINDNDAWTRQDCLTIHILGASQLEVLNSQIFEEILHRLRKVKTLNLVLCGPELARMGTTSQNSGELIDMETCPNCQRTGRKRLHQHYNTVYHSYAKTLGDNFAKPDLAVAFNSGCSQEAVSSWKETISFLVKHKIPSVFTAFNREEAEAEAEIMKKAGATLFPTLGPVKNPWGSTLLKQEPNKCLLCKRDIQPRNKVI